MTTAKKLDQLQLVPSGGDIGHRGPARNEHFVCHDIRVQLRELKLMELVSSARRRFEHCKFSANNQQIYVTRLRTRTRIFLSKLWKIWPEQCG
jgi:hypothetical protein